MFRKSLEYFFDFAGLLLNFIKGLAARKLTFFVPVAILAIGIMTYGLTGTSAWFSDTATTPISSVASGTLILKINGQDEVSQAYSVSNLKPNAREPMGQVILKNEGSIKGLGWFEIVNVRNFENGCLYPETKTGDKTCGAGSDQGELGLYVKISFQTNPESPYRYAGVNVVNASGGQRVDLISLEPGQSTPLFAYAGWTSTNTDNLAQGDSVIFDVVFHLDQVH